MAEFLAMGGYAFYVWVSYGMVAVILVCYYVHPVLKKRKLLRDLAAQPPRTLN